MIKRRRLLRGLAAGAVGLPFLSSLLRSSGEAQPAIPRRVFIFYGGSGSVPGAWQPVGVGGRPLTESEWEFGPMHAALAPYRDDTNYYLGLSMGNRWDNPTGADAHSLGKGRALTNTHLATPVLGGGISIDQHIARGLALAGVTTALASVEVAGFPYTPLSDASPCYSGSASPVPLLYDPANTYMRLFGAGPEPGMSTEPDPAAGQQAARLAFLESRFDALARRLSPEDREKLGQHREALARIRRRIEVMPPVDMARIPDPSILDPLAGVDLIRYDPANYQRNWDLSSDLNMELAVSALHADVTRVATLAITDAPNAGDAEWWRWGQPDSHEFLHSVADPSNPLASNPEAEVEHRRVLAPHATKFRQLLDMLATRTESDGQRLLDHTLVLWCSEIADGSHAFDDVPWCTVGSCGGALRTGQAFRVGARSHGDLFATIATAVGVPTDRFGTLGGSGPISEALT